MNKCTCNAQHDFRPEFKFVGEKRGSHHHPNCPLRTEKTWTEEQS